jgi:hypothetical protein
MKMNRTKWLIIAGMGFLGMYIVIAGLLNNFSFPNFHYSHNIPLFMGGIPSVVMYSQYWKLLFLFPAIVLFSVALMKSDIRFLRVENFKDRFIVIGVLLVAALILILSTQLLFHETEVTDDENTYDFQAQTLLAGRIDNPPPPVRTSFDNVFIINDGSSWIGRYTMGHPAIIAAGMMLGDRYVGIITISILTLLLLYLIGRELYADKRVALLALCLGAISPFFYLISSSRLSHTTTAFFLALFMYLLLRARRSDKLLWAIGLSLLAGFSLGYAFNTRPWTAFAWSLPFLVVMAKDALRFVKHAVARGAMLTAGFAVLFFVTLHCNAVVTGNPMQFPYSYFDSTERLGFGVYGHTLLLGIRNLIVSLTRLNVILFGFPISLIFIFLFLFSKKEFGDRLSFGVLGSVSAAYLFFYTPGVSDLGPVYYYELLIPLLLLSARGVLFLHEKCSAHFEQGKRFIPAFLLVSCLAALGTTIPERISHVARLTDQIRQPYTTVQSSGVHHALVMIQPFVRAGWVFGYRNPSPQFTDDIVYCQYADSISNHDVVQYFHDRAPYVLKYDSTASQFVVLPVNKETGKPTLLHP